MEAPADKGQWFVVHTLSGQENRAGIRSSVLQYEGWAAELPVLRSVHSDGKGDGSQTGPRTTTTRKFFPGYLLVRMDIYLEDGTTIDEKVWYFIRIFKA